MGGNVIKYNYVRSRLLSYDKEEHVVLSIIIICMSVVPISCCYDISQFWGYHSNG